MFGFDNQKSLNSDHPRTRASQGGVEMTTQNSHIVGNREMLEPSIVCFF